MNNRRSAIEGESGAAKLLEDKGFKVIERNYRTRAGEIDIVAKDGNTYVRKVLTMDDIRNTMYEALTPAERIRVDSIVKTPDFKEYQEAVQTWTAKRVLYMNALSDEEFYSLKKENGLTDMEALSNRDSSIKEAFEEYDNAADRFYSKYGSLGRAYGVLCFAASEVGYEGPLPNRL